MFINANLGADVAEPQPVAEGTYLLRVVNVQNKESKGSGAPMVQVMHEIDGEANAAPIFHYLVLPKEDDEPDKVQFKLLQIKRYLHLAGIPFEANGFNEEDLMGAEFEASLEFNSGEGEYPPSNQIRVPRLPAEKK